VLPKVFEIARQSGDFGYSGWRGDRCLKRKPVTPKADTPVPAEILELAHDVLSPEKPLQLSKCVVCQGECAPNSTEGLCWVCRRLKISAWRDSDQQVSAQE
jgi:hypothetical protein